MSEDAATAVRFEHHRWYTRLEVDRPDGSTDVYYFSADSSIADSGLWFGTEEDYNEASEW